MIYVAIGLFGLVVALALLAGSYIVARQHAWPAIGGVVVWRGHNFSGSADDGSPEYSSAPSVSVRVVHRGRDLELEFDNAPVGLRKGDAVQVRVHPTFPRAFSNLVDGPLPSPWVRWLRVVVGVALGSACAALGIFMIGAGLAVDR